jgi:hypothetical protein
MGKAAISAIFWASLMPHTFIFMRGVFFIYIADFAQHLLN